MPPKRKEVKVEYTFIFVDERYIPLKDISDFTYTSIIDHYSNEEEVGWNLGKSGKKYKSYVTDRNIVKNKLIIDAVNADGIDNEALGKIIEQAINAREDIIFNLPEGEIQVHVLLVSYKVGRKTFKANETSPPVSPNVFKVNKKSNKAPKSPPKIKTSPKRNNKLPVIVEERKVSPKKTNNVSKAQTTAQYEYPDRELKGKKYEYSYSFVLTVTDNNKLRKGPIDDYELQVIHEDVFDVAYENLPDFINSFTVSYASTMHGHFFSVHGTYIGQKNKSNVEKYIKEAINVTNQMIDINTDTNIDFILTFKKDLKDKKVSPKKNVSTLEKTIKDTSKLVIPGYYYANTEVYADGHTLLVRFNKK